MIQLIVFLPLIAAIVAGLGQRLIGATVSKAITTGAVMTAAVLSWLLFFDDDLTDEWLGVWPQTPPPP